MTVRPARSRELFDTVRHLRPVQIGYLIRRRIVDRILRRGLPVTPTTSPSPRTDSFSRVPFLPYPPAELFDPNSGRLTLLNLESAHRLPVAWERSDLPPLWVLELQYFHWLRPQLDPARGLDYLVDWIRRQPNRLGTAAWNPFGVAMRVLQWTRLLAAWRPALVTHPELQAVLASLYRQARFLAAHQEFEFLGNHLLKTAAGLYAAGRFFSGTEAADWERRAAAILLAQAEAQTLPDGGHYERSPMYHLLVLVDLLDVLNMTTEDSDCRRKLTQIVERQLAVARGLMDPLEQIPLTNDSVLGQAPEPTAVLAYAEAVLGRRANAGDGAGRNQRKDVSSTSFALPDFGLYHLTAGDWCCWVDAGLPGPDFLLAHAHADLGSVLAWLKGHPLLVEAGVYGYGGNPSRRDYDRNAYGHNVLILDGHGVCHCWQEFRVGRRVHHVQACLEPDSQRLAIEHDGFAFLPGAPAHQRRLELHPNELRIVDRLGFRRPRRAVVELIWHLDPAVRVDDTTTGLRLAVGTHRLAVDWRGPGCCHVKHWPLARRFYISETGAVLVMRAEIEGDTEFETRFRLLDPHGS